MRPPTAPPRHAGRPPLAAIALALLPLAAFSAPAAGQDTPSSAPMTAPTASSPEDDAGHALAGHRSSAAGRQLGPARLIYPRGGAYRGFDPGTGRWYPSGNVGLVVRPKRISVGNEERILISGIRWRGWGSRTAVGTGRARVCFASGCDAPYAGRVRLGGLRRSYCERNPNYYRVYTTIRLRLPGGGFGSPLRISPGIYC